MDTLYYLVNKYNLDLNRPSPIEIPNVDRDILALWFKELHFKRGVELGVGGGLFSEVILTLNPDMEYYCVDPWKTYPNYRVELKQEDLEQRFKIAQARLRNYPNVKYVRKFSKDAFSLFEDNSLDFVYLDANHSLPWVMDDIVWWDKKVKPGGIVSGHNYYIPTIEKLDKVDVVKAVSWYTELKPVKIWFLLGTATAVAASKQMKERDGRSWMWVR